MSVHEKEEVRTMDFKHTMPQARTLRATPRPCHDPKLFFLQRRLEIEDSVTWWYRMRICGIDGNIGKEYLACWVGRRDAAVGEGTEGVGVKPGVTKLTREIAV